MRYKHLNSGDIVQLIKCDIHDPYWRFNRPLRNKRILWTDVGYVEQLHSGNDFYIIWTLRFSVLLPQSAARHPVTAWL